MALMGMRIKLFGNLRISCAGRPVTSVNTNRLHSLVAYLVLHGDAPQPRERLAFVLWPASNESQARTNLRQLLHHLKRALPAECDSLVTDHFSVRWRQDVPCAIDVVEFQAAIAEAALARTGQDRAREVQSLTTAAQLYEDDLLPSLYDDWLALVNPTEEANSFTPKIGGVNLRGQGKLHQIAPPSFDSSNRSEERRVGKECRS